MSWGTKIILTFAVFMIGMIGMVVFVFNLQIDLVEDNYYDKEIKYQDQIDILSDTRRLEKSLDIKLTEKAVSFNFPEHETTPAGEIQFYRPSDAGKDFKLPIKTGEDHSQSVSTAEIAKGLWKIKVTWMADNKKFYSEETIFIN